MKKILVSIAILGAIILCSSLKTNATTVRCWFYITVTDNCTPGGYSGDYCVQIRITYDGSPICTPVTICGVKLGGPSCYYFDCNIPDQLSVPKYGVLVVGASREGPSCVTSININYGGNWSWNDITTCTKSFSVTVQ